MISTNNYICFVIIKTQKPGDCNLGPKDSRCSKSASTMVLPEIICLLWITENLSKAFWEIKRFEDDSGVLPFSDLTLLDIFRIINKDLAWIIEGFTRKNYEIKRI